MQFRNQTLIVVGIVILVIICMLAICVTAAGIFGFGYLKKDTAEPAPTLQSLFPEETEIPVQTEGNLETAERTLPFYDDFSNPDPSWFMRDDDISFFEYTQGGLRMFLNKDDYLTFTAVDVFAEDVIVEVDAQKIAGPEDNSYGVVCRQQGDTYYYFEITSDGYYKIARFVDDEYYEILPWTETEAILPGNGLNHIRIECVGTTLAMYVNGISLAEVQDNAIQDGYVGLVVGSFENPGVDLLFDNFYAASP